MNKLFNDAKRGEDTFKEHLLAQYKLYHATIETISERRHKTNVLFITVNTLYISMLGFVLQNTGEFGSGLWLQFLCCIGVFICWTWYKLIVSHRQSNEQKFKVLKEIEAEMPMNVFDYEWKIMEEGKNKGVFHPFSKIEPYVPIALGLVYIVFLLMLTTEYWPRQQVYQHQPKEIRSPHFYYQLPESVRHSRF